MDIKCSNCDMIALQHWFEAGTTFIIGCDRARAEDCYKSMLLQRVGKTGQKGYSPKEHEEQLYMNLNPIGYNI